MKLGLLIKKAHETRIEKGDPRGSWREALMADRDDQYTFNKCMRLSKNKKYNFKKKRIKRNEKFQSNNPQPERIWLCHFVKKSPQTNKTIPVVWLYALLP